MRPYDDIVDYALYGMGDANHQKPSQTLPGSESMGGFVVMFGGACIDWKSYRFHCITVDVTSGETIVASRLGGRLVVYLAIAGFLGLEEGRPPLFTDNDGTWYVARDATTVTKMTHVIRHVRLIQERV